jgi:hypothetical protein
VTMAGSNPTWGYTRLRGALRHLGHEIGRNTIKRILQDHGIVAAPERGKEPTWKTFIKAHFGVGLKNSTAGQRRLGRRCIPRKPRRGGQTRTNDGRER